MDDLNIVIEKAAPTDVDALIGLLKELFSIERDFQFNESLHRRGLTLMLEGGGDRCILVARTGQKVVGMISVQTLISTAAGGRVGLVEDMVVSQSFRRKGIGKRLLTSLKAWAKGAELLRLQLLADNENGPALGFYEKMDWKTTNLICLRKQDAEMPE